MDRSAAQPWTLSALASTSDALDRVGDRVLAFNERHAPAGVAIVAVEWPARDLQQVAAAARAIPDWLERYMETTGDGEMLDAIAEHGCYAKLRTGGVVAQAFPSAEHLATFVMACAAREIPFKATAGLHHPVRGRHPLTYAPDSDTAVMHGFVNLVLAAAATRTSRADLHDLIATLETDRPAAFAFSDETAAWGTHSVSFDEIVQTRAHLLRSIGSCSFEEPVEELRRMEWLR
jgi:hypothetical protein